MNQCFLISYVQHVVSNLGKPWTVAQTASTKSDNSINIQIGKYNRKHILVLNFDSITMYQYANKEVVNFQNNISYFNILFCSLPLAVVRWRIPVSVQIKELLTSWNFIMILYKLIVNHNIRIVGYRRYITIFLRVEISCATHDIFLYIYYSHTINATILVLMLTQLLNKAHVLAFNKNVYVMNILEIYWTHGQSHYNIHKI